MPAKKGSKPAGGKKPEKPAPKPAKPAPKKRGEKESEEE